MYVQSHIATLLLLIILCNAIIAFDIACTKGEYFIRWWWVTPTKVALCIFVVAEAIYNLIMWGYVIPFS